MALTASASLKLDTVLGKALIAFKRRILMLRAFSTIFQAAEVPKDRQIQVPYVPLEATDSIDWNPANGYGDGDFNIQSRGVPVNKRKFQVLSWSSGQLLGIPIDVLTDAIAQKTDKLAYDVIADIASSITVANYGAAITAPVAASAFTTDDVIDIGTALTNLNWPQLGRSLVLHQSYTGNLKKDPALKNAQASGSTLTLREGVIGRVDAFDVSEGPVPDNGEHLVGFACLPSALLIASAPIEPEDEVKSVLSDYRVFTDPDTGITLTYRAWGSADFDKAKRIVEFGYGFAVGDAAQLKRIESPAS